MERRNFLAAGIVGTGALLVPKLKEPTDGEILAKYDPEDPGSHLKAMNELRVKRGFEEYTKNPEFAWANFDCSWCGKTYYGPRHYRYVKERDSAEEPFRVTVDIQLCVFCTPRSCFEKP
jgi:hypothetical protein